MLVNKVAVVLTTCSKHTNRDITAHKLAPVNYLCSQVVIRGRQATTVNTLARGVHFKQSS